MKLVNAKIKHCYRYGNSYYIVSKRKSICVGDLIYDGRDDEFKIVESEKDAANMCCVAPELYVVLEKEEE